MRPKLAPTVMHCTTNSQCEPELQLLVLVHQLHQVTPESFLYHDWVVPQPEQQLSNLG
jgi:hypothetical protein